MTLSKTPKNQQVSNKGYEMILAELSRAQQSIMVKSGAPRAREVRASGEQAPYHKIW